MSIKFVSQRWPSLVMGSAMLLSLSSPALAADRSVKLTTYNPSQTSIYIEYELEGSTEDVDVICAILDYDFADGFYQVAPQESSRRQVKCNSNLKHSTQFQDLESSTSYWLSLYAYKMGGQGFVLPSGGGGGIAGKEIKTAKASITFSASASNITAYSVNLSTTRAPENDEYYGASCSPYTGYEESDGFVRSTSLVVGHLQPSTRYTCRIYVYPSSSGGNTQGVSSDVVFTTLSATPNQNPSSTHPQSNIPPAGYEDEVLTNFNAYHNPFPDTNLNELSGKSAAELYRRSVIGGFPDGQFKGDRSVNRAEAAKFLLLARFQSVADVTNSGKFPDVLDGQWYTKFVVTAAQKGIINGYPDGLFRPADEVNTVEFLKMLSLTFDLELNMSYRYNDVPSHSWFAQYAGIAQKYNLFPGRSSNLSPETPLSRADVAIAIYQYLSQR